MVTRMRNTDRGAEENVVEHEQDQRPHTSRAQPKKKEIGGPKGPEPTRYGDWERNGRCTDF